MLWIASSVWAAGDEAARQIRQVENPFQPNWKIVARAKGFGMRAQVFLLLLAHASMKSRPSRRDSSPRSRSGHRAASIMSIARRTLLTGGLALIGSGRPLLASEPRFPGATWEAPSHIAPEGWLAAGLRIDDERVHATRPTAVIVVDLGAFGFQKNHCERAEWTQALYALTRAKFDPNPDKIR